MSKIALFTWSTRSVAAAGQCIKSTFRDFSRQDSFFGSANPAKHRQLGARSGSATQRIRPPTALELEPPQIRLRRLEISPIRRAQLVEPECLPGAYALPLVIAFQANTGVLSASFSRDRPNGPGGGNRPAPWR